MLILVFRGSKLLSFFKSAPSKKFRAEIKILKFGLKNTLFGYFSVAISKIRWKPWKHLWIPPVVESCCNWLFYFWNIFSHIWFVIKNWTLSFKSAKQIMHEYRAQLILGKPKKIGDRHLKTKYISDISG